MSFEPTTACRLLNGEFEETWMKTGNLLLSSLPRGPVRPPGNGCNNTSNGGNPCVNSKKVAGRRRGGAPPPPLTSTSTSTDQSVEGWASLGISADKWLDAVQLQEPIVFNSEVKICELLAKDVQKFWIPLVKE
ncbi:hypothetical protein L1887_05896 [Cichorium endivia]|nr:hypothetical protein L1887_05896 [Cichorium endivia]